MTQSRRVRQSDAPAITRDYLIQYRVRRCDVFTRWWSGFIRIRALTISIDWRPYQRKLRP